MMSRSERESAATTATTTEARAGSTPHMTRYVLSIGLILLIILFSIILLVGRS
jgi:flagellar biogenesis protein FliO